MPERTMLTTVTQLGVEVTPGTAVAANKKLLATSLRTSPQGNINTFRPMGLKFKTIAAMGKEWTEHSIEGFPSYSDLSYLLSGLVSYAAPVQQGVTPAYLWTFTPDSDAEDTIKTFTAEEGSSIRAHRAPYVLINSLELTGNREEVSLSGSAIGARIEDGVALTAAPTEISPVPILGNQVDIYLDDTSGALGTTKLTRVLAWRWAYGGRFSPLWTVNSAATSFAAHTEAEPSAEASLTLEADATGMGLLATMRAGDTKYLRIVATGATISGAYAYKLQIDGAVKIGELLEFSDEDGVYATRYPLFYAHDSGLGRAFQIQLTNTLTAL